MTKIEFKMTQQETIWNALREEEQESYLEEAKEQAKENNKDLKSLGYDSSDAGWLGKAEISEMAVDMAWNDSTEGKAQAKQYRDDKAAAELAARHSELKAVKDAYEERGMYLVSSSGIWEEYAADDMTPKLCAMVLKEVEEARKLGL